MFRKIQKFYLMIGDIVWHHCYFKFLIWRMTCLQNIKYNSWIHLNNLYIKLLKINITYLNIVMDLRVRMVLIYKNCFLILILEKDGFIEAVLHLRHVQKEFYGILLMMFNLSIKEHFRFIKLAGLTVKKEIKDAINVQEIIDYYNH